MLNDESKVNWEKRYRGIIFNLIVDYRAYLAL